MVVTRESSVVVTRESWSNSWGWAVYRPLFCLSTTKVPAVIRLTCPNCRSELSAKDELAGQTRNCPKCAQPLQILAGEANVPLDPDPPEQHAQPATEDRLSTAALPSRLNRECHYLICDKTQLVAIWANDGRGWMCRKGGGFIGAKRDRESLPQAGDFQLVELKFSFGPEGKRLMGLKAYRLVSRWALTVLDQGDDEIVGKIVAPGSLNRDQKAAVRQTLRDLFMRDVWESAADVLEYLGNADYHSSGVESS